MRAIALATEGMAPWQNMLNLAALLRLAGCGAKLLPPEQPPLPEMFAAYAAAGGVASPALPPWPAVAHRRELEPLAALLTTPGCRRTLAGAELALADTPHAAVAAALHALARHVARDRQRWARRWVNAARTAANTLLSRLPSG